jgi:hypothetical protein
MMADLQVDTRTGRRLAEARHRFLVLSMCHLGLPVRRPDTSAWRQDPAHQAWRGTAGARAARPTPLPAP